jgi:DNA-binding transcriptional ArsR family regulator
VQSEKAWYVSELARRMHVPASSLQRELQALSEVGILKTHRQGRMVYYQANADSPVFSDLRGLLLKTAGFVDVLAQALKPLKARLLAATRRDAAIHQKPIEGDALIAQRSHSFTLTTVGGKPSTSWRVAKRGHASGLRALKASMP